MTKIRFALAAVAMAGMLAACGSSDDSGSDDGVVSLGSTTTGPESQEQTTETSLDPQEAMLAYTECMREEGIDMPDPEFSDDGGMVIRRGGDEGEQGPAFDPESEEFKAAEEKCAPIRDEAVGSMEVDPEQQAERREQMLEYAQCMRDHGIDFPDPEFGDDGTVQMRVGDGEQPTDAEREAMDAANEACAQYGGPMAAAPADGQDD